MNKKLKKYLPYIIISAIVIIIVIFARLNITSPLSKKTSLDWSRGKNLGKTISGSPVSIQIDNEDKNLYLIWSIKEDDKNLLNFTKLNNKADILLQKFLDFNFVNPKNPQILLDSHKNLHLLWLDKFQDNISLFHVLLNSNGDKLTDSKLISIAESEVKNYKIGLNKDESVEVFWECEEKEKKGIYHLRLSNKGEVISENILIISNGKAPSFQIDKMGNIHLIWYQSPYAGKADVYYSKFDVRNNYLIKKINVGNFLTGTGRVIHRPVLGLDNDYIYIFWSTEFLSGLSAGTAELNFLTFPIDKPSLQSSKNVILPFLSKTDSIEIGGKRYNFGKRQVIDDIGKFDNLILVPTDFFMKIPPTDYIITPNVTEGQNSKLALVCSLRVFEKTKRKMQLALVIFQDGNPLGYQLIAKTDLMSFSPKILFDIDNKLYLTWLDKIKTGQHRVYFAGTSSNIRENLDVLVYQDIIIGIFNTTWNLISSIAFIWIVLLWGVAPALWLGIYYMFTGEDRLYITKTKIAFIITIIIYYLVKLILTPSFLLFPPFYDLIPARFSNIWISVLPVVILIISLLAVFRYLKKSETKSLLISFVIFLLTDGFLTVILYWPQIF
ncbi:MAG: hypothetical protein KAV97_04560 [Actinomycetia bacterium]|nr:hypothetical protein [Actinomycetes bacterium]